MKSVFKSTLLSLLLLSACSNSRGPNESTNLTNLPAVLTDSGEPAEQSDPMLADPAHAYARAFMFDAQTAVYIYRQWPDAIQIATKKLTLILHDPSGKLDMAALKARCAADLQKLRQMDSANFSEKVRAFPQAPQILGPLQFDYAGTDYDVTLIKQAVQAQAPRNEYNTYLIPLGDYSAQVSTNSLQALAYGEKLSEAEAVSQANQDIGRLFEQALGRTELMSYGEACDLFEQSTLLFGHFEMFPNPDIQTNISIQ